MSRRYGCECNLAYLVCFGSVVSAETEEEELNFEDPFEDDIEEEEIIHGTASDD